MALSTTRLLLALSLVPAGLSACSQGGAPLHDNPSVSDLAVTVDLFRGPSDLAPRDAHAVGAVASFGEPLAFPSGGIFGAVQAADLDGDGVSDIAMANESAPGGLDIWLGKGDGTLRAGSPTRGTIGHTSISYAIVTDLDLDGKLDVIASSFSSSILLFALGKGDGTFADTTTLNMPLTANGLAAADFNGDKKPDLVVTCAQVNAACILLGKGGAAFNPVFQLPVEPTPDGVAVGDVNGDRLPDIVTANYGAGSLSILISNGDGTFRTAVTLPIHAAPVNVKLVDLNRDGALDIVTTSDQAPGVAVLLGTGLGTFQTYRSYPTGAAAYDLVVTDLNGDGFVDVATPDLKKSIAIFMGRGDGTLGSATLIPAGGGIPYGLAAGDFNRDGKLDLVVGYSRGKGGALLLNTTAQ